MKPGGVFQQRIIQRVCSPVPGISDCLFPTLVRTRSGATGIISVLPPYGADTPTNLAEMVGRLAGVCKFSAGRHTETLAALYQSERRKASNAARSATVMAHTACWLAAASPRCHRMASSRVRARPSCR